MADGIAFTVNIAVTKQPPDIVYVILLVPAATAATVPVELPTVATEVAALIHVPPDVLLLNVALPPTQADNVPVIADGNALTV